MTKIYLITLYNDLGEVWLNDKKEFIGHVDGNDAAFQPDYHGFIFQSLGIKLVKVSIDPRWEEGKEVEKQDAYACGEKLYEIFKQEIENQLSKIND